MNGHVLPRSLENVKIQCWICVCLFVMLSLFVCLRHQAGLEFEILGF